MMIDQRRFAAFCKVAVVLIWLLTVMPAVSKQAPGTSAVLETMKRATRFMVEKVSYQGGYLWAYLSDFSRRWGEMEARETMVWVQPPGTATMGHLFLDAYHATGDEYYYQAAEKAALALIAGQHPSGGWNYMIDFAGEDSLREWYDTIGASGWRLEEFQHYYGNATFDDEGTAESAKLLLRMYLEKRDKKFKPALDKAIDFVVQSQYDSGGWPQRYPPAKPFSKNGRPDYSAYITFNDDVAAANIDFLILCYQTFGDKGLLETIRKGMDIFVITQLPEPQAGWALQYTRDLKPAGARSYEPEALSTSATLSNIVQLMKFYSLTGDRKYLKPIPPALKWLESVRLPEELIKDNRTHPMFVELETNKTLYLHRRGSNVVNGEYYADYNPEDTISHYRSVREVDVDRLRKLYKTVKAISPKKAKKNSPLYSKGVLDLPRFFLLKDLQVSDLNSRSNEVRQPITEEQVKELIGRLNSEGYWPTPLKAITNPYIGPGLEKVTPGDFSTRHVGDKYDTSPYFTDEPEMGISTGTYIKNMIVLIEYLQKIKE